MQEDNGVCADTWWWTEIALDVAGDTDLTTSPREVELELRTIGWDDQRSAVAAHTVEWKLTEVGELHQQWNPEKKGGEGDWEPVDAHLIQQGEKMVLHVPYTQDEADGCYVKLWVEKAGVQVGVREGQTDTDAGSGLPNWVWTFPDESPDYVVKGVVGDPPDTEGTQAQEGSGVEEGANESRVGARPLAERDTPTVVETEVYVIKKLKAANCGYAFTKEGSLFDWLSFLWKDAWGCGSPEGAAYGMLQVPEDGCKSEWAEYAVVGGELAEPPLWLKVLGLGSDLWWTPPLHRDGSWLDVTIMVTCNGVILCHDSDGWDSGDADLMADSNRDGQIDPHEEIGEGGDAWAENVNEWEALVGLGIPAPMRIWFNENHPLDAALTSVQFVARDGLVLYADADGKADFKSPIRNEDWIDVEGLEQIWCVGDTPGRTAIYLWGRSSRDVFQLDTVWVGVVDVSFVDRAPDRADDDNDSDNYVIRGVDEKVEVVWTISTHGADMVEPLADEDIEHVSIAFTEGLTDFHKYFGENVGADLVVPQEMGTHRLLWDFGQDRRNSRFSRYAGTFRFKIALKLKSGLILETVLFDADSDNGRWDCPNSCYALYDLAARHRPLVSADRREVSRPTHVGKFIRNSELKNRNECQYYDLFKDGVRTAKHLDGIRGKLFTVGSQNYYVAPGDGWFNKQEASRLTSDRQVVYCTLDDSKDDYVYIHYWFFFNFSCVPMGLLADGLVWHEGDVEFCQVTVRKGKSDESKATWLLPFAVTAAQHYYGQTLPWDVQDGSAPPGNQTRLQEHVEWTVTPPGGESPHVYVALGSHATLLCCDDVVSVPGRHRGMGTRIMYQSYVEVFGEEIIPVAYDGIFDPNRISYELICRGEEAASPDESTRFCMWKGCWGFVGPEGPLRTEYGKGGPPTRFLWLESNEAGAIEPEIDVFVVAARRFLGWEATPDETYICVPVTANPARIHNECRRVPVLEEFESAWKDFNVDPQDKFQKAKNAYEMLAIP